MSSSDPWVGMDPNTQHQEWARWVYVVTTRATRTAKDTRRVLAPVARQVFGAAAEMSIDVVIFADGAIWTIQVQAEHTDCQTPGRVTERHRRMLAAIGAHWTDARVQVSAPRLLAGRCADGSPASQLIVAPTLYDEALLPLSVKR